MLRYWETEFKSHPPREDALATSACTAGATSRRCCTIKHLLYDEGFRIDGAKRRLRELAGEEPPVAAHAAGRRSCAQALAELEKIVDDDETFVIEQPFGFIRGVAQPG